MILSELETTVRHLLDESDVDNSHWTSGRIKTFLNEGGGDVALHLPPAFMPELQEIEKHHLQIGISDYEIESDYIKLHFIEAYGKATPPIDKASENVFTDNIFYTPSTTNPFTTVYGNVVTVKPTPIELVDDGLQIHLIRPPVDLVLPADVPELPSWAHYWMALYAEYKCLLEDGDERANAVYVDYLKKFERFGK